MVPATVKYMSGVRGGIYHKSGPFEFEEFELKQNNVNYTLDLQTVISSQAIYAGLFRRSITNVSIDAQKYGKRGNSAGSEIYFDAMLFVNNSFKSAMTEAVPSLKPGDDVDDAVKAYKQQGILGFRTGYRIYQIAPQSETGKKFGMCGTFELGYRPYHGFFINAGLGMTLVKNRP